MSYQFSIEPIISNWGMFVEGGLMTLLLTALGSVVGIGAGILGAVSRAWKLKILHPVYTVYVECVRNTPFLVQLYFIFFGLPALGVRLSGWEASFLAMALNLGAYSTEIIRAGVQSIPRGQMEAAESLALSRWQTFRFVVLRPALKNVWPALCSQIIIVMLGSSVCSQVAAQELTYTANLIQSRTFRAFEIYAFSTFLYLLLAIMVRKFLYVLGNRFIFGRTA
ncbi:MAG: amino acid ABC transporter permease [Pseudodesulfovibrio sp.]|jgi:His/Glu/Gln/Arg/opine family amino acid ABC transporter permease subunit|uniref:ABC transporter permease n=1 Tax=Pseudodesulfovibrio indicus TaxID=1716143 RepID=A0A126QSS1_9BACT|nr:amino acid ABC transporter permease [Pseudodesulfovibrio indicus]AMK12767.1 ABC transporter permease [Pseudodesulfovibrio indicus]TDT86747.1 amino acid ABC transporter membrane protein 1 (PAAT family) [Pseudodesulfovibrio indicus]